VGFARSGAGDRYEGPGVELFEPGGARTAFCRADTSSRTTPCWSFGRQGFQRKGIPPDILHPPHFRSVARSQASHRFPTPHYFHIDDASRTAAREKLAAHGMSAKGYVVLVPGASGSDKAVGDRKICGGGKGRHRCRIPHRRYWISSERPLGEALRPTDPSRFMNAAASFPRRLPVASMTRIV